MLFVDVDETSVHVNKWKEFYNCVSTELTSSSVHLSEMTLDSVKSSCYDSLRSHCHFKVS